MRQRDGQRFAAFTIEHGERRTGGRIRHDVEQKMTIALEISDEVNVMGHGQIVFTGTPEDLRASDDVRQTWFEVS